MKFNNLKLWQKIGLGASIPLTLMLVLGQMSRESIDDLLFSNERVDHTHKVIQEAMKIEAAAVDIEV